jgi:pimeloyl-ACP methyl ester carboxylesterase
VTTDEDRLELPDGRTVGFADLGTDDQLAVLWCHGGPGSRLEPEGLAAGAGRDAGLRMIGIDRPGYGHSTPVPGRSIADWVPDGLAVADHLGIDRFVAVGVSTGGAYALALASMAPDRVQGVVACCALTDMRWAEGKAMMSGNGTADIWASPDRDAAMKLAADLFGEDGSKMFAPPEGGDGPAMAAADLALLSDPTWLAGMATSFAPMFAQGVTGYADDRLADGPGWGSFDVGAIRCPVEVIHGGEDTIVPVAHAHHTAAIVPSAALTVAEHLGHLSIVTEVVPAVGRLRSRSSTG